MQQHRRILQNPFTKTKATAYQGLQLKESYKLVKGIMQHPGDWELEFRRIAISIVANVAYGVEINSLDHPWVKLSDDAGYATSHAVAPGGTLVDRCPLGKLDTHNQSLSPF